MKENFCDIQKNMQAAKELNQSKTAIKFFLWLSVILMVMFLYMCYWYGQERESKEYYKDQVDSLKKLTSADTMYKIDTSMINKYYIVNMEDKKLVRLMLKRGFVQDTTFVNPYVNEEEILK